MRRNDAETGEARSEMLEARMQSDGTRQVVAAVALFLLFVAGCHGPESGPVAPADSIPMPARGFYMGVLPMPAEGQSLDSAYALAAAYSEFVPVWGRPTPFYDLAEDLGGAWGRTYVEQLIRDKGMFPLVQMSFMDTGMTLKAPPELPGATLSDSAWRAAYKQAALDVVRTCRPRYLSIGNEVNRWYEKYDTTGTNGFQHYVSLFCEMYDTLKALSPGIVVFCSFAREIVSENREADLSVLSLFPQEKLDLLVFTSYPHAVQGRDRPESIPDDYYSRVLTIVPGKLVGFSEVGWPSLDAFGGEQSQADFIVELGGRLTAGQGTGLHLLGWPWLCDLDSTDRIGLFRRDGSAKPAWEQWKLLSARPAGRAVARTQRFATTMTPFMPSRQCGVQ
jgi:hypothetical protein